MSYPITVDEFIQTQKLPKLHDSLLLDFMKFEHIHLTKTKEEWHIILDKILKQPA